MKKAIFTFILSAFMISTNAQRMVIHKKNGEKLSIPISQILKVTYEGSKKLPIFILTQNKYSDRTNLEAAVKKEYTGKYRIADWNDVLKYSKYAEKFVKEINLDNYESVLITAKGKHKHHGVGHYFLTYHNHRVPINEIPIAHINDHYLSLMSSINLKLHILCIKI